MWPMNSMHESNQQISEGKAEIKQKGGSWYDSSNGKAFQKDLELK